MVENLYVNFEGGRKNSDDAEHSGRSNSTSALRNIKSMQKIIFEDRKVKLHEVADTIMMLQKKYLSMI